MSTRETGLAVPALPHRSREYVAALATAAFLAQLLLVQLTLVFAVLLAGLGKATRWRPHWLAVPGGLGAILVATRGPRSAVAGYSAWSRRLADYLAGPAGHSGLLASAAHDVPRQLPLALLSGAAEAAGLVWLTRPGRVPGSGWRPGLIAAVRRWHAVTALSAGQAVTADGCVIGIEISTGRRAELSWQAAEQGVLVCGGDQAAAAEVCLPVLCAALRRRKAVVIADLTGGGLLPGVVRPLAGSLGVPLGELAAASAEQMTTALGQVIRRREVVLAAAGGPVLAGLTSVLASLQDLRLRGDLLAWIHGCERADPAALGELIAAGHDTGCSVVLSTSSRTAAGALADAVEVVIVTGPAPPGLAGQLAAAALTCPGTVTRADRPGRARAAAFPHPAPGRQAAAQALAAQLPGTFAILAGGRLRPGYAAVPPRMAGRP